jgi:hypothetical protein
MAGATSTMCSAFCAVDPSCCVSQNAKVATGTLALIAAQTGIHKNQASSVTLSPIHCDVSAHLYVGADDGATAGQRALSFLSNVRTYQLVLPSIMSHAVVQVNQAREQEVTGELKRESPRQLYASQPPLRSHL